MKKILLFLSLSVAIPQLVRSQITITSSDIAPIYTVIVSANDTTPSITLGSAGASQIWDYSMLNNQSQYTYLFTLPQFTHYGSYFPNANLADSVANGPAAGDNYLQNLLQSCEIWGAAADPFGTGAIPIPFNNSETYITFPSTMGTSFTDTATAFAQQYYGQDPGIGFTVDSFRVHMWVKKTSTIDGWGTVTTPAMANIPCIRQNFLRVEYDTLDIYAFGNWANDFFDQMDSNRVYAHWANGVGMPVCELTDYQDQGTITSGSYVVSSTLSGINELNAGNVNIYPVPANDMLNLSFTANAALVNIYDVNGKVVLSNSINSNSAHINTSSLANGIYFYDLLDANGISIAKNKFSVSH